MQTQRQRLQLVLDQLWENLPPLLRPALKTYCTGSLAKLDDANLDKLIKYLKNVVEYIDKGEPA